MKLELIMNEWEADTKIDKTELGEASLRLPILHHKYYKMFIEESLLLKKLEGEFKILYRLKHEYYMGLLDRETLKEKGWDPNPLKILKSDLPVYLESDSDMQVIQARIDIQNQKVTFLESAIKTINNRGFLIKNAIDFLKFQNGI